MGVKRHTASLEGAWTAPSVAWAGEGKTGFGQGVGTCLVPTWSGTGFAQALASKLRLMITAKGAEILHTWYFLAVILDCFSEAEGSSLVY